MYSYMHRNENFVEVQKAHEKVLYGRTGALGNVVPCFHKDDGNHTYLVPDNHPHTLQPHSQRIAITTIQYVHRGPIDRVRTVDGRGRLSRSLGSLLSAASVQVSHLCGTAACIMARHSVLATRAGKSSRESCQQPGVARPICEHLPKCTSSELVR